MCIRRSLIGPTLLALSLSVSVAAQRPRTLPSDPEPKANAPKPAPAPQSVKAKYEGGIFGYPKTMEGTLSFDDAGRRLVFKNEQQKETFSIPYDAVSSAFADTQKRRPAAATVASNVPYIGFPAGFIKTTVRYLTIQYRDPDSRAAGVTSFRLDNRELVASMLEALAGKAELKPRGDVFVRQTSSSAEMVARVDVPRPAVAVENEALSNRVISLPRPIYPEEARQAKVGGTVRVLATVDEQGNVVDAEAISGSPLLQQAAVDAAKQAKFEPLLNAGRPVKTKTTISYNFVLN